MASLYSKNVFLFDAFGTLFKTIPIDDELKKIAGSKSDLLLQIWRRKQLEYSWLRNQMKRYVPFDLITKEALFYAMKKCEIADNRILELLLPIYHQPVLNDGASDLILTLKKLGKQVGILSNGTLEMLRKGAAKTGLNTYLDFIISVDEIGIYKPAPEVYELAQQKTNANLSQILFFSSNQWDVSGASCFGFEVAWVNQYDETKEELPFGQVIEVKSLASAIDLLTA